MSTSASTAAQSGALVVASRAAAKQLIPVAGHLRHSYPRVVQQTIAASGRPLMEAAMDAALGEAVQTLVVLDGEAGRNGVLVAERINGRFRPMKNAAARLELAAIIGRKPSEGVRKR